MREKAIEIANASLEEGMEEGKAIGIARQIQGGGGLALLRVGTAVSAEEAKCGYARGLARTVGMT